MRDDLFRNLKAPRKWKKAFDACVRLTDQGYISKGLIADALLSETRESFSLGKINKMVEYLQNPELPFNGSAVDTFADRSGIKLTPEERRCFNLAEGMLNNGREPQPDKAVTTALHMLLSEKCHARLNQAEICVNETESNPDKAKIAIRDLREFSEIDIKKVVNKLMDRSKQISFSNQIKILPDEDLS